MKVRKPLQTSFSVRHTTDLGRAAWRVVYRWRMPRIELGLDTLPTLETHRSQLRLRRLHEIMERRTGALFAIAVLMIGLADMVRTWNRDLEHMGLLVAAALGAGLAGRILGRTWVRIRVLFELLRLRWKVSRQNIDRAGISIGDPAPASEAPPRPEPLRTHVLPASVVERRELRHGSCGCGAVTFTLSSPPSIMGTCHCVRCRKSGGGTFVQVKRSAFSLVAGADVVATYQADTPHASARSFCSRCGTALGEITSEHATFRVAAACFDDELGVRNGFHEFVSEKPSWLAICDEARQFQTRPGS
jgi:hypothetical protein